MPVKPTTVVKHNTPRSEASLKHNKPKPSGLHGLQLGNVILQDDPSDKPGRIALLLWGDFGVGKTTFAATAPGKKLWLNVDPDGYTAIRHRIGHDVILSDLVGLNNVDFFRQMQNENPLSLDAFLEDHPEIETIVLDSATAMRDRAIHMAVDKGVGKSQKSGFTPTIEEPGMSAYGARNAIVLECVSGLLRVTAKHNRHCIILAHEADPEKDDKGLILYITMNLGGQLYQGMGYRFSEIWYISQDPARDQRRLAIRPTRLRRPMKTRMFRADQESEFVLNYDATKPDNKQRHTIAAWYDAWMNSGEKLDVPK